MAFELPITKSVEKDQKTNRFVEAHKTYDLQNQRRAVNENQLLSAKPYCLDKLEFVFTFNKSNIILAY